MTLRKGVRCLAAILVLAFDFSIRSATAGGVTLITHGFNSSTDGWIIGMASQIPLYPGFPGTNFSCYEIAITQNGQGQYIATPTLLLGSPPSTTDSGEIIIKLDWSSLSIGTVPTTTIASTAAAALLATNLIPALAGRSLVEMPLHFVGHSRGASVITEMARILGAEGLWIDQVTTLDPHPVSFFGDPSMKNYANILFADNYWQNLGNGITDPTGQLIPGAYNRQLTNLTGGNTLNHSDVHLWYHGTIQLTTPASDTEATITSAERLAWWLPLENAGTNAGFLYSLLGGGDRFSTLAPAGKDRIRDGVNQVWDLGLGINSNRDALATNNGSWPNLIRLDRTATNSLHPSDPIPLVLYYRFGASTSLTATVDFALDPDLNPYNTNEIPVSSALLPATGTNNVYSVSLNPITPNPILPGGYSLLGKISFNGHTRLLYAPQKVQVIPGNQPPVLLDPHTESAQFIFTLAGVPGQKIVIQQSSNLVQWISVQTNTLATATSRVTNSLQPASQYFRGMVLP